MNISQAAHITGLSSKTIRDYEQAGLIAAPERGANGYRQYTAAQWIQLRQQVEYLCGRYGVPLQLATAATHWRGICGHRDTGANKTCPGFDVGAWLAGGMQPLADHLLVEKRARP